MGPEMHGLLVKDFETYHITRRVLQQYFGPVSVVIIYSETTYSKAGVQRGIT
jgi:hypothetical protein